MAKYAFQAVGLFVGCKSLCRHLFFIIFRAQSQVGERIIRLHRDRFLKLLYSGVKIALKPRHGCVIVGYLDGERIQLSCSLKLLLSHLGALEVKKIFQKAEERTHRIWIESNGFFEFALGFVKFPFVLKFHVAEGAMGFGQVGINIQCHLSCSLRFGKSLLWWKVSPITHRVVGVCQARVGERELWIQSDRLLEMREAVGKAIFGKLVELEPA